MTLSATFYKTKMEKLYPEVIERIADGARFTVNLQKRSLKLNGKYIIRNGKYDGDLGVDLADPIEQIEYRYERYRHSIPSERNDNRRRHYFQALPESKLDEDDMLYGIPREIAAAELEIFILLALMTGALTWETFTQNDPKATWFWKSPNDHSLIIFKYWVENPEQTETTNS